MMLRVIKAINEIGNKYFEKMLIEGKFPEVHYSTANGFRSYYLFEYSDLWATFMKVLDKRMKEEGLDERLGVFTRKHSKSFLEQVGNIASLITEEDVRGSSSRFRSFADGVRDYAMEGIRGA